MSNSCLINVVSPLCYEESSLCDVVPPLRCFQMHGCWQNVDPPFGPRICTLLWTSFWTLSWTRKFFWRKKNMTVHAKTCVNAVWTRMHLFHQKTQANALSNGPAVFFQTHLRFLRTHLRFFGSSFLIRYAGSNFLSNVPDLRQAGTKSVQIVSSQTSKLWQMSVTSLDKLSAASRQKATFDFLIHTFSTFRGIENGISISRNFAEAYVYFVNIKIKINYM